MEYFVVYILANTWSSLLFHFAPVGFSTEFLRARFWNIFRSSQIWTLQFCPQVANYLLSYFEIKAIDIKL